MQQKIKHQQAYKAKPKLEELLSSTANRRGAGGKLPIE